MTLCSMHYYACAENDRSAFSAPCIAEWIWKLSSIVGIYTAVSIFRIFT